MLRLHDLRIEGEPTLSNGYLARRVVKNDVEAAPANESMGDIEVVTTPRRAGGGTLVMTSRAVQRPVSSTILGRRGDNDDRHAAYLVVAFVAGG